MNHETLNLNLKPLNPETLNNRDLKTFIPKNLKTLKLWNLRK
jgi:hypothetical protein